MIVEQRTYTLVAGGVAKYLKLYEEEGFAIQGPALGNLVGWYFTEFGALNQIVHMWGYEDYADRETRRAALAKKPEWQAFVAKIRPLLIRQENKIMTPAPWSPK